MVSATVHSVFYLEIQYPTIFQVPLVFAAGFTEGFVNLTIEDLPLNGSSVNGSSFPMDVHEERYTVWSPVDVDLSPAKHRFDDLLRTANFSFLYNDLQRSSTSKGNV